jgi:hypothetical protein
LANVAAGIVTFGSPGGVQTGTAVDSMGTLHTMKFTRPVTVPIYVHLYVNKNAKTYPADGNTLIKEAIVLWGDAQDTGKNAVPSGVAAQAFQVTGVQEVPIVGISTAAIATPTNWAPSTAYSVGNVVVNSNRMYRCSDDGTSASSGGPSGSGNGVVDGSVQWDHLGETIQIALRELATYDTSRIAITAFDGTP